MAPAAPNMLDAIGMVRDDQRSPGEGAGRPITRSIYYSGGFKAGDGEWRYTIEVYAAKSGQAGTFTW